MTNDEIKSRLKMLEGNIKAMRSESSRLKIQMMREDERIEEN